MPEVLIQMHDAESRKGDRQETKCPHRGSPLNVTAKAGSSGDDLWIEIAKGERGS